jgi:serine protease Do
MSNFRWYWIIIYSTILLLTGCGAFKKSPEDIRDESRESIVLISRLAEHGSGFFIEGAPDVCTILTAKHVVPEGNDNDISIQTIAGKLPFKPANIQRSEKADLAVLTFKPLAGGNCSFPALKLGDYNSISLAQPIYISSYAGSVNGEVQTSFYITSVNEKRRRADGDEIGYKADTQGGISGSPVLNELGEVIAVHKSSYLGDKNSNPSPKDRAYVDLGVPITLYQQDAIAKSELDRSGSSLLAGYFIFFIFLCGWFFWIFAT